MPSAAERETAVVSMVSEMFAVAVALLKSTCSKFPPEKPVTVAVSVHASRYTSSALGLGTETVPLDFPAGMVTV